MILYQMVKWLEEYRKTKRLRSQPGEHKLPADGRLLLMGMYEHMLENRIGHPDKLAPDDPALEAIPEYLLPHHEEQRELVSQT